VLFRPIFAAEFPAYDNVKPGTFAFVKLPRSVRSGGYLKPSMFWSVNAHSQHIEEAKKFIDWFIHDKEAADILGTSRGIPVSSKILDYLQPKFNQVDKTELELIKETAPDANSFNGGPKGWGNFANQDYVKATEELMFGKQAPEQVYQEIKKKFNETIKVD
jgi:ABC-type glycerol-3-phosphate transport system substrate-binding protein